MKNQVKFLKEFKKDLVGHIRGNISIQHNNQRLWDGSWWFRHAHIADCLLRGRAMEQIEHKNREGNEPAEWLYELLMTEDKSFDGYIGRKRQSDQFEVYLAWKEAQNATVG